RRLLQIRHSWTGQALSPTLSPQERGEGEKSPRNSLKRKSFRKRAKSHHGGAIVEITHFLSSIVSSPRPRRNNSPAHETIFRFSRRHPETFGNYQTPHEAPPNGDYS